MIAEIADIEARAKAAKQPMLPVMERAKVAYTTWTRWKRSATAPNLATLNRVRSALDELLSERQ